MGKSFCASVLQDWGFPVFDTDLASKRLVEPGTESYHAILKLFGASILAPDVRIDRKLLARTVFSDAAARKALESILHPRIRNEWMSWLDVQKAVNRFCFIVIPLLFETESEKDLDQIWCIACTEQSQLERLTDRGWTSAESTARIDAQLPLRTKVERADAVIWTEGLKETTKEQMAHVLGL